MAPNNTKQVKVWILAHKHLGEVAKAFSKCGQPKSMTVLASEWLLAMPFPNGWHNNNNDNGHDEEIKEKK